jgi:hypothetical protein
MAFVVINEVDTRGRLRARHRILADQRRIHVASDPQFAGTPAHEAVVAGVST